MAKIEEKLGQIAFTLEAMQKSLECTICFDILTKPMKTKCGHNFCWQCLQQLMNKSRGPAQCPICQANIAKRSIGEDVKLSKFVTAVRNVILSIKADCGVDVDLSKPKSKPLIAYDAKDDDSENEENDKPRRGSRSRAQIQHIDYDDIFPENKLKTRGRIVKKALSTNDLLDYESEKSLASLSLKSVGRKGIQKVKKNTKITKDKKDSDNKRILSKENIKNIKNKLVSDHDGLEKDKIGIQSESELSNDDQNVFTGFPPNEVCDIIARREGTQAKVEKWLDDIQNVEFSIKPPINDIKTKKKETIQRNFKDKIQLSESPDKDDEILSSQASTILFDSTNPTLVPSESSITKGFGFKKQVDKHKSSLRHSKSEVSLVPTDFDNVICGPKVDYSSKISELTPGELKTADVVKMPPPKSRTIRGTLNSSIDANSSKSSNTRYGSEFINKFLENPKIKAATVDVKSKKSPGWSHIDVAKKDMETKHLSLTIVGGENVSILDSVSQSDVQNELPLSSESVLDIIEVSQENSKVNQCEKNKKLHPLKLKSQPKEEKLCVKPLKKKRIDNIEKKAVGPNLCSKPDNESGSSIINSTRSRSSKITDFLGSSTKLASTFKKSLKGSSIQKSTSKKAEKVIEKEDNLNMHGTKTVSSLKKQVYVNPSGTNENLIQKKNEANIQLNTDNEQPDKDSLSNETTAENSDDIIENSLKQDNASKYITCIENNPNKVVSTRAKQDFPQPMETDELMSTSYPIYKCPPNHEVSPTLSPSHDVISSRNTSNTVHENKEHYDGESHLEEDEYPKTPKPSNDDSTEKINSPARPCFHSVPCDVFQALFVISKFAQQLNSNREHCNLFDHSNLFTNKAGSSCKNPLISAPEMKHSSVQTGSLQKDPFRNDPELKHCSVQTDMKGEECCHQCDCIPETCDKINSQEESSIYNASKYILNTPQNQGLIQNSDQCIRNYEKNTTAKDLSKNISEELPKSIDINTTNKSSIIIELDNKLLDSKGKLKKSKSNPLKSSSSNQMQKVNKVCCDEKEQYLTNNNPSCSFRQSDSSNNPIENNDSKLDQLSNSKKLIKLNSSKQNFNNDDEDMFLSENINDKEVLSQESPSLLSNQSRESIQQHSLPSNKVEKSLDNKTPYSNVQLDKSETKLNNDLLNRDKEKNNSKTIELSANSSNDGEEKQISNSFYGNKKPSSIQTSKSLGNKSSDNELTNSSRKKKNFKRIRPQDSSDSDSEVNKTPSKRQKKKVKSLNKVNASPKADPTYKMDSQELTAMERYDSKIWDNFGQSNIQECYKKFTENESIDCINIATQSSEHNSTNEVIKIVNDDLERINESRRKRMCLQDDKESSEIVKVDLILESSKSDQDVTMATLSTTEKKTSDEVLNNDLAGDYEASTEDIIPCSIENNEMIKDSIDVDKHSLSAFSSELVTTQGHEKIKREVETLKAKIKMLEEQKSIDKQTPVELMKSGNQTINSSSIINEEHLVNCNEINKSSEGSTTNQEGKNDASSVLVENITNSSKESKSTFESRTKKFNPSKEISDTMQVTTERTSQKVDKNLSNDDVLESCSNSATEESKSQFKGSGRSLKISLNRSNELSNKSKNDFPESQNQSPASNNSKEQETKTNLKSQKNVPNEVTSQNSVISSKDKIQPIQNKPSSNDSETSPNLNVDLHPSGLKSKELQKSNDVKLSSSNTSNSNRPTKCIICTGLNGNELRCVKELVKNISKNDYIMIQSWSSRVTHVIVKTDTSMLANRTLKYLYGVASRCWILDYTWISKSLEAKTILPEIEYEVLDCTGNPGPKRARESSKLLFENCKFFLVSPFTEVSYDQLKEMLIICGGTIASDMNDLRKEEEGMKLVIVDTESEHDFDAMMSSGLLVVQHDWIVECIGMYSRVCITPYICGVPSQAILSASNIPDILRVETQEIY